MKEEEDSWEERYEETQEAMLHTVVMMSDIHFGQSHSNSLAL